MLKLHLKQKVVLQKSNLSMRFALISPSEVVLSVESIVSLTVMTEAGEITIMPKHEPLISALRPGILHVSYYVGHKIHENTYVTGG